MPYRRLPNTDRARVRAMDKALKKSLSEGQDNCAISEPAFDLLESYLPQFQHALINLEAARKNQISKNKEYTELFKKAKIYISHFIHVINFSIARGELKSDTRDFYGLSAYSNNLPSLVTGKNLLEWGKKLIEGEQKRIQGGGNPIYNPSIALVKVNYEKFADAFYYQKNLISTSKRASKLVSELRIEADKIILQIWNEVEQAFFQLEDIKKREKASEYGIAYVFRKHEILKALNPVESVKQEKGKELEVKPLKQEKIPEIKRLTQEKKNESEPLIDKTKEKVISVPIQSTIEF
jgi:hypothetical protein